jgi:hypothetical protein
MISIAKYQAGHPEGEESQSLESTTLALERGGGSVSEELLQQEREIIKSEAAVVFQRLLAYEPSYQHDSDMTKGHASMNVQVGGEDVSHPSGLTTQENKQEPADPWTIFKEILKYGHDEDFDPEAEADPTFLPTDAPAGSEEKIEILKRRIALGQPLFHSNDRVDYAGLTGVIRPRE